MTDQDPNDEIRRLRARLEELEGRVEAAGSVQPPEAGVEQLAAGDHRQLPPPAAGAALDRRIVIGGSVGIVLLVGAFLLEPVFRAKPAPAPAAAGAAAAGRIKTYELDPKLFGEQPGSVSNWSYRSQRDEMRDAETTHACVRASDIVNLTWPYPDQALELCTRKSPKFGKDILLSLPEGGQFMCRSYNGCTVKVRFDDGAVQTFSAASASDGSSDVIFITNAPRFAAALRRAKTVRIEAEFYQAGIQASGFDVEGWDAEKAGF